MQAQFWKLILYGGARSKLLVTRGAAKILVSRGSVGKAVVILWYWKRAGAGGKHSVYLKVAEAVLEV